MKFLMLLMTYGVSLSLRDRKGVFSREIRVLPDYRDYTIRYSLLRMGMWICLERIVFVIRDHVLSTLRKCGIRVVACFGGCGF